MYTTPKKKIKINLSDYNSQKEVQFRLFLSSLNEHEMKILREIQLHSLKFPISELLHGSISSQTLEKFQAIGLLDVIGREVRVCKELRKYFEIDTMKFEEDFELNIDYVQTLIHRLPQHILPVWYPVPQSSNDIFAALFEKVFKTPKAYNEHLSDLSFEDIILEEMIHSIHSHPDMEVRAETLKRAFSLTDESFHQYMLLLEFHFTAFLSYRFEEGKIVEIVSTLKEWKEWNGYLNSQKPKAVPCPDKVEPLYDAHFGALKEINALNPRFETLLVELKLAKSVQGALSPTACFEKWKSMTYEEQAVVIYRHISNHGSDNVMRQVEKSLKRILYTGWILVEDFLKVPHNTIGHTEGVRLKKLGGSWSYKIPEYLPEDKNLIVSLIQGPLFLAGITALGTYEGKPCFILTPFGKANLG